MFKLLRQTVLIFLMLTILTGIAYPVAISVASQMLFPWRANGSLIEHNGKVIGSELIGQQFDNPRYFWGRPSATAPAYHAAASTGSNYGPTNPAQLDAIRDRVNALRAAEPQQSGAVPVELVTASGSGLDPHISPAAANYQVARVAKARGIDAQIVRRLMESQIEGRTLGLLGEPRINVLRLNLALDSEFSVPSEE